MKQWLCILLLAAGAAVQAAPETAAQDDLEQFLAENRLFGTLGQMGHALGDRASELVVTAMGFLGVPYRPGGSSVDTGFDCSGFVQAMYQSTVGLVLPRRADEQAAATRSIDSKDLQPGDLVFFNTLERTFSHVGIYIGDGKFIHSPKPGAQVRVENMGVAYWKRRFDGARRVLAGQAAQPPQASH